MDDLEITQPPQNDSSPLFVSLYVVLLAFFIMLNTIATFDKSKTDEAIESVGEALDFRPRLSTDVAPFLRDTGVDMSIKTFFSEMRTVAESYVPIEKLDIQQAGRQLEIRMPADALFEPGKTTLRAGQKPLIHDLARAMETWLPGLHIGAEWFLTARADAEDTLEVDRAGALAHQLAQQKIPARHITAGLLPEKPGTVVLRFSIRDTAKASSGMRAP